MTMKPYFSLVTLISLISVLIGCSLYKTPEVKPIVTPKDFKENLKIKNTHLKSEWWKNFHDENLNNLVNRAIRNNLRYKMALENIKIAHTYITESNINRLPEINASVFADNHNFANNSFRTESFKIPTRPVNVGFDYLYGSVSYELDIWNQKTNITHMAEVNEQISHANRRSVQLALISEVVNTYFQIQTLNSIHSNFSRQLQISNENLKITKAQHGHGYATTTAVNAAQSSKEQVIGNISTIRKQQKLYVNHLAYLLGEYPEKFHYVIKPKPAVDNFRSLLPRAVPAQVLGNRPDVQRAFLKILSYDYLKKETLADFLPTVNLFASYGNENFSIVNLVQGSTLAIYGMNVVQKITGIARNFSRYERTKNLYTKATLNYRDAVLNAFQEVNNALLSYNEDSNKLMSERNIIKYGSDQLKTAKIQYKSGAIDYNTYLQVELSLLQNQYNLEKQNMVMYRDIIQIYKALGLGLNEKNPVVTCVARHLEHSEGSPDCSSVSRSEILRRAQDDVLRGEQLHKKNEKTPLKSVKKKTQTKLAVSTQRAMKNSVHIATQQIKLASKHYTIQLVAVRSKHSVDKLNKNKKLFNDKTKIRTLAGKKGDWYVLTLGEYKDRSQAQQKIKKLPAQLAKLNPWITSTDIYGH